MRSVGMALLGRRALVICTLALACGDGSDEQGGQTTCATNGTVSLGEYVVENDSHFNSGTSEDDRVTDFSMCVSLGTGSAGTVEASWSWDWPTNPSGTAVYERATPGIIYGFDPRASASSTPALPTLVSDIESLTVDASVRQTVGPELVAEFGVDVYLTKSSEKLPGDATLPIYAVLHVDRNRYGFVSVADASDIAIDGMQWDLHTALFSITYSPHVDASVPATSLHLELAEFLADALDRGLVEPDWWVASVETVNSVWEGTGSTALSDYAVKVTPAP